MDTPTITLWPKARLAFMHICSEAVKARSRFLEIEQSARAFMDRIGIGDDGRSYSAFRKQMNALAACSLRFGYTNPDGKAVTLKTQPIEQFEVWGAGNEDGQPALWDSCLTLSEKFYQDLVKHAVLSRQAPCVGFQIPPLLWTITGFLHIGYTHWKNPFPFVATTKRPDWAGIRQSQGFQERIAYCD
jgi:hypothetical protein